MPNHIRVSKESNSNLITRDKLKVGQVYRVTSGKHKDAIYGFIGVSTIPPSNEVRYRSMNLNSGEMASTSSVENKVEVVGTFVFDVTMQEDFAHLAK